jgi:DNA-binding GntR family transcriptional regulator
MMRIPKISKTTLRGRNYEELRKAIICGQFEAGETLTIRALSEALGTSTTPVREALQQLVAERVLTCVANKEFRIPMVTKDMFNQIYHVRILLEGYASYQAATLATSEQINTIQVLHDELKELRRAENNEEMLLKNMNWHFAIYNISNEAYLADLIQSVWLSIGPIFAFPYQSGDLEASTYRDAVEPNETTLINAISNHDSEGARIALETTLSRSAEWFNENYNFPE